MKTFSVRFKITFVVVLSLFSLSFTSFASNKPDHLIVMVFDAMRPDYITRFDLKNFKRLQRMSTNYPEAYVGHLFSETVVAHEVIPTGLLPKDLPWSDDHHNDKTGRVDGRPGYYGIGSLTGDQFLKLLTAVPKERFLQAKLKEKFTSGKVYSIGTKQYAAWIFGGPYADSIITVKKDNGKCFPFGKNVPEYIAKNERFVIDCKDPFGTENSFYPYDGARMVHGSDEAHMGGDVWIADAALEVMNHDEWSGLFLTFPAIDKAAHMQGTHEGDRPLNFHTPYTLPVVLKKADEQLGRILDELQKKKLLDRTMIVVTADHGGQGNQYYFGTGGKNFTGLSNNEGHSDEQKYHIYWAKKAAEAAKIDYMFYDSCIRVWVKDRSPNNTKAVVESLMVMSGVTDVWEKQMSKSFPPQYSYKQVADQYSKQPKKFIDWAKKHYAELLATVANEESPDYVAFTQDDVGYGLLGDHGGAQEKVQRIPMIIHLPGQAASTSAKALRLVDLRDMVVEKMGL